MRARSCPRIVQPWTRSGRDGCHRESGCNLCVVVVGRPSHRRSVTGRGSPKTESRPVAVGVAARGRIAVGYPLGAVAAHPGPIRPRPVSVARPIVHRPHRRDYCPGLPSLGSAPPGAGWWNCLSVGTSATKIAVGRVGIGAGGPSPWRGGAGRRCRPFLCSKPCLGCPALAVQRSGGAMRKLRETRPLLDGPHRLTSKTRPIGRSDGCGR